MQDLFYGHYKPTKSELEVLWRESIFVFDANILLNLYRYSESTREGFLRIIASISDRVWLPYQVAEEFFANRIKTTGDQAKSYDAVEKFLAVIMENIENQKRHPFIKTELYTELESVVNKVKLEFKDNVAELNKRIYDDEILKKLTDIFSGKISHKPTNTELDVLTKDGEDRYEMKIPPGYKDGNKDTSGNRYRKFGDLIIWRSMIEKAKNEKRSIIFITDDEKEDWWLIYNGRTIAPLPALIQEFFDEAGQRFYIFNATRFVENATEYSEQKVSPEIISELKDFRSVQAPVSIYQEIANEFFKSFEVSKKLIDRPTLLRHLKEYAALQYEEPDGFIQLSHFLSIYLAELGYNVESAYALINQLNEEGIIQLYDRHMGANTIKAIKLSDNSYIGKMRRLPAVAKEFNVGMYTISEYLSQLGFDVTPSPISKITPEMYSALKEYFSK